MARPTSGRKSEFLGIPVDVSTKQRLKKVAKRLKRPHTDVARRFVIDGIEREEQPASK